MPVLMPTPLRHMFEEENRKAQELLEAAAQHHEQLQQKCQQLQQKRQRCVWRPSPQSSRGRWLRHLCSLFSLSPGLFTASCPFSSPSPSPHSYPTSVCPGLRKSWKRLGCRSLLKPKANKMKGLAQENL